MRYLLVVLVALCLSSCSRDPNYLKQQYVTSGNKYFDHGKYKEASIYYRKAIAADKLWGPGYYHLSLTFLKQGAIPSAVQSLRRAVELLPKNTPEWRDASLKLGEILVVASQSVEKNEALLMETNQLKDEVLKRSPEAWEGHKLAGDLSMIDAAKDFRLKNTTDGKKDLGVSITEYRKALAKRDGDSVISLALGRTLVLDGEVDEALNLFKGLIQKNKADIPAYMEVYRIYAAQRKLPEAEATLKTAVQADPKNSELRMFLAQYYLFANKRDEMVKLLDGMKQDLKSFPKAYFVAGDFYLRVGQVDEAVKQYEEGIKNDSANKVDYLKHEVEAYIRSGKADLAFQKNEQILKIDARDPESRGLKATFLLDKGDVNTAEAELQSVVTAKPSNFVARFNLGRAHFARGEYEQARQEFDKAVEIRPDYLPARLAATQVALLRNDTEGAMRSADAMLKIYPNNAQAVVMKAAALQRMGKLPEARTLLDSVLASQPKQPETLLELGVLNLTEKKYKDAEEMFRRAWEANPNNLRGILGLTEAMLQQGQRDRAVDLITTEVKKNPNRLDMQRELGNVQMRAGKFDEALSTYSALLGKLKEPKQQADLETRIGETYARKGDVQKSIEALEKARTADPTNPALPTNIAMLLEMQGKIPDARKYYELAVKADPNNPIALNNLAYLITETNGDLDLALTYAQRAKQKLPDYSEISDTLGWIYLKKNLTDNAMDTFKNLVTKSPQNPTYHFHYAMALGQKGERDKALKECQQALLQKPKKEEEDKIRDLIKKMS